MGKVGENNMEGRNKMGRGTSMCKAGLDFWKNGYKAILLVMSVELNKGGGEWKKRVWGGRAVGEGKTWNRAA